LGINPANLGMKVMHEHYAHNFDLKNDKFEKLEIFVCAALLQLEHFKK
jgi:hypothetical protein